ncbi:MAG: class I SAM-dependent methyltransferase [Methanolinea sp.]|nr:class I SAM-dependent methyltransferase [Methanolinea sp.]
MDASSPVHAPIDPSQYDSLIGMIVPGQSLLFRMIIDNLPDKCGSILELGCGTGLLTGMLRRACPSAAIDAIDISEEMVLAARRKKDLSDVTFFVRDLRDTWPEKPYDAIVTSLCLHHVPEADRIRVAARASQALEPGGRFLCGDIFRAKTPWEEDLITCSWKKSMEQARVPPAVIGGMLRERRERLPRLATVSGFAGSIRNAGFFRVWVPFTAGFVGLIIGEVGNGRIHPVPESGFCPCSHRDGWALCRP